MKQITQDTHFEIYGENIIVPFYSNLKKDYCARYCRFLARDIFNIEYLAKDSWNYPLHNRLILDITNLNEILIGIEETKINAGNVFLCKYPRSRYSKRLDENENRVIGTHLCIYLGENLEDNLHLFAHQFGKKQYVFSLEEFSLFKLSPKKVMAKN